ncbi:MAG TPA: histidine kinase dimerization/phospho-acceptor domain-containing protein, partial [Thermoanaerobaculaceae bacterium]|nr:histidine kinase dimerization/phospho-acceptor domain-containing protein [Thermoanaerobaculaceae bacterium]
MSGEEPVPDGAAVGAEALPDPEASPTAEDLAEIAPELEATLQAPVRARGRVHIDLKLFHEELRRANLPLLFWTVAVFNVAYLAWGFFDYVLVPDNWRYFLTLRLIATALNALIVIIVYRPRLRSYTWEAFWAVGLVFNGFIAPMLPLAAGSYPLYFMGFSIIIFGAGLLPFWPPTWAVSIIGANLVSGLAAFVIWPSTISSRDLVGSVFFVATAAGLSIATASFKYDLARRDYSTRSELYAVARREANARHRLARATTELQDALERLKELDRLKSKFFANVSHELRTPLTLILAPIEEMAQGTSDRNQLQFLRVVRRNAHRLLRLIDDLLDLSRLDAGGLRLDLAEIDIRTIAASVHENSKPAAMAKGIEFTFASRPSNTKIFGDAHRLEIVLTNLVGNALKFTPPKGRIGMHVEDLPTG